MKTLKRVVLWMLISLIVQLSVFFYLDKFYLKPESSFKDTIIQTSAVNNKKIDLKIPVNAQDIKTAYDGKYSAFLDGSILKILNAQNAEIKTVEFEKGVELSYYRWFPDADILILAEKHSGSRYNVLKFSSYNAKKNERTVYYDKSASGDVEIQLPDTKSKVTDIELSTLTNMIYVEIQRKGSRNSLYSINVMGEYEKVSIDSYFIGDLCLIPHEANGLLYEDTTYNKVRGIGEKKSVSVKDAQKLGVIAADNNDNVYLGSVSGDKLNGYKVSRIYYGKLSESTGKWQTIDLKGEYNKKDIFVTLSGRIFLNDSSKGVVKEIKTGIQTSYTGQFVSMFSEETDSEENISNTGIVSIDNGKVYMEKVK